MMKMTAVEGGSFVSEDEAALGLEVQPVNVLRRLPDGKNEKS